MSSFVRSYRGPILENLHRVHVAIVGHGRRLLGGAGDPSQQLALRSTAKPFQAQALVHTGALERFGVTSRELAVICASHDAQPQHLDLVTGLLDRLGLAEAHLDCGPHLPMDAAAAARLAQAGEAPTALHNNCSGKHAGMLAACVASGAPVDGYLDPEHPIQRLIRADIAALTGGAPEVLGTDGCSAPTFGVSVEALARAFYFLAAPEDAPGVLSGGLARAGAAMRAHPELVHGPGKLDAVVMARFADVTAKRGAAGCYGMALARTPRGPLGVGIKVEDGSGDARDVAVFEVLAALGLEPTPGPSLEPWRRPTLRNCRDRRVGHREADLALAWA